MTEVTTEEQPSGGPSLKRLAVSGTAWTSGQYAIAQALRFGSNLILTRLLVPDDFGLMGLVAVCMQGLGMLSDIGIEQSVIQNKRGDEPAFFNTAWLLQVVRGFTLFFATALLAWPVAIFYEQPMLLYLLPAAGLSALIAGFDATRLFWLNRHLQLRQLAVFELACQIVGIAVTVTACYIRRDVWGLVIGGITMTTVRMAASHLVVAGPGNRVQWDRDAARQVARFGRWIFISSALGFVVARFDQIVLGRYLDIGEFGVYWLAATIATTVVQGVHRISSRVLFPLYGRLHQESPETLRRQTFKMRSLLIALTVPPACVLAVFGDELVHILFPDRFANAGWMLEILGAGAVVSVVSSTIGPALLAVGDSYRYMVIQGTRAIVLVAGMYLGHVYGGFHGVLVGIALADALNYPVLAWSVRKYGVWLPALDLPAFAVSAAVIAMGWRFLP